MDYSRLNIGGHKATLACFRPCGGHGLSEIHAMVEISDPDADADCKRIVEELSHCKDVIASVLGGEGKLVFARFMVADQCLGQELRRSELGSEAARSVVVQRPLGGSPVTAWFVWLRETATDWAGDNRIIVTYGDCKVMWEGDVGLEDSDGSQKPDSRKESEQALEDLERVLDGLGYSLAESCHRTWFMVRDIDENYSGVVEGRNHVFKKLGLTRDTHFIASTGIGGSPVELSRDIVFNSYSVLGLDSGCVTYLKASENMNNTMDYGVAFERGTALEFADRRQVLISGTASIDNRGRIVHEGDVARQTFRMMDNVDALMKEAGVGREDMCYAIVYLRNPEDYETVAPIIEKEYPDVPLEIVHAPVCRKGWLVEMECALLKKI